MAERLMSRCGPFGITRKGSDRISGSIGLRNRRRPLAFLGRSYSSPAVPSGVADRADLSAAGAGVDRGEGRVVHAVGGPGGLDDGLAGGDLGGGLAVDDYAGELGKARVASQRRAWTTGSQGGDLEGRVRFDCLNSLVIALQKIP
jgi:hypothetical protein